MKWMEPLVVRLAGQAHLESAIPHIIAKLQEDGGDLLNEECAEALTRIGTPAVLHAIAEAFPDGRTRTSASTPPGRWSTSTPTSPWRCASTCSDRRRTTRFAGNLAHALLCQFAPEGIEAARQLLVGRELDFEERGLRDDLLETCTLMGERFPEYDEWLAAEKAEKEEHWKRVKELEGDPRGLLLFALEKLTGKKAADVPKAKPTFLRAPPDPAPQTRSKRRSGGTIPAPAGAGRSSRCAVDGDSFDHVRFDLDAMNQRGCSSAWG